MLLHILIDAFNYVINSPIFEVKDAMVFIVNVSVIWDLRNFNYENAFIACERLYFLNLIASSTLNLASKNLFLLLFVHKYREVSRYMFICHVGAFVWFKLILIMLAINRCLSIYLNVRYITLFDIRKIAKVVLGVCFGIGVFTSTLLNYFFDKEKTLNIISCFPFDKILILIYIFVAIYNYSMGYNRETLITAVPKFVIIHILSLFLEKYLSYKDLVLFLALCLVMIS